MALKVINKGELHHALVLYKNDTRTVNLPICIKRYADGVDLADLGWHIKIVNASGATDTYTPITVNKTESEISFDWLIRGPVITAAVGTATYQIEGAATDASGNTLVWQSGIGTIEVRNSLTANPTTG